jgi:hypothetical protein
MHKPKQSKKRAAITCKGNQFQSQQKNDRYTQGIKLKVSRESYIYVRNVKNVQERVSSQENGEDDLSETESQHRRSEPTTS